MQWRFNYSMNITLTLANPTIFKYKRFEGNIVDNDKALPLKAFQNNIETFWNVMVVWHEFPPFTCLSISWADDSDFFKTPCLVFHSNCTFSQFLYISVWLKKLNKGLIQLYLFCFVCTSIIINLLQIGFGNI